MTPTQTVYKKRFSISFRRAAIMLACGLLAPAHLFAQAAQEIKQPGDDPSSWTDLSEKQIDEATIRSLKRIVWAVHAYAEANEHKLVPAAIPNEDLPMWKRLSGLVALLPYLGVKPSYIEDSDATWTKWKANNDAARKLYDSIDRTKSWDDPANATAATTIVSSFVTPSGAALRDSSGYAVSHFALVRGGTGPGGQGLENGAFPLQDAELHIPDISDGTNRTFAAGQIHEQLGPWIAAGPATSRYVFHPAMKHKEPRFGSQHKQSAYFANCDAFCYFLDLGKADQQSLRIAAGRYDGQRSSFRGVRFPHATAWKKANAGGTQ